jgi:beta-lactamase class A
MVVARSPEFAIIAYEGEAGEAVLGWHPARGLDVTKTGQLSVAAPKGLLQQARDFMKFDRRRMLALGAPALVTPVLIKRATAADGAARAQAAVDRFARIPATASCLVVVDQPSAPWRAAHDPAARMFVGSAVKTFILAQYLREVEAGRLTEDQQAKVDDAVRSASSPVFLKLTGTTQARSALEAMIAHSDNTATDIALAAAGPAQVRTLIAAAGLKQTQIPESTRRLFSYIAGAPEGVDIGWDGIVRMENGGSFGTPRPPLNDKQTMASTAEDMVRWYQQVPRGAFFKKPQTLVEFKRISAMADAIAMTVPPDTPAYGKGGSIDWEGFHCLCFAGQMIVSKVPVSFCLTINWNGPDDKVAAMKQAYLAGAVEVLAETAQAVG